MNLKLETSGSVRDGSSGSLLFLTFICIVSAMGGLLFGFDTVVISGARGLVTEQFEMNEAMEGWFVSSALWACAIGAIIAGALSDQFGRKKVLILSGILFIVSAYGCGIAESSSFLVIARIIGGLGVGIASMISPLYISEISPPSLRGRMVTLFQFAITIGICLSLFSNAGLQAISEKMADSNYQGFGHRMIVDQVWRGMFVAEVPLAVMFFLLCLVIPESPRWLIKTGRTDKALGILSRVAIRVSAKKELEEIENAIAHEGGSLTQLFKPGLGKAMFVALFLSIVSELSGITIVFYYGPGILEKAGFKLGDALGGFVSIGLVNVAFTVFAICLMDKLGRRLLLFIGNCGCFIALATIGVLFASDKTEGLTIVFMMCLFVACFAFSMGPIKWVVMSEIFPTRIRGRAVAIATLAVWVTDGVYNQLFPMVKNSIGISGIFFIFAGFLIPQFFFVWKIMPETKNRTLEEIEQSWIS